MSVVAGEKTECAIADTWESSSQRPLSERRQAVILLAIVVLVGVGIRLYRISQRSIWFDEASSWRTSQFAIPDMLRSIGRNNHVPLHYLLLKFWTAIFGDSLLAMRGLSTMFSGVTIVGVYLFCVEAFRSVQGHERVNSSRIARWIGLFAASLVGISILQIRYGWEVRMYTLGTALTALSSWTLFRALFSDRSRWKWILHALVTLLLAYTHHFALFTIAGQAVFLFGFFLVRNHRQPLQLLRDKQLRAAALTYLAVAVGWTFWLPVFFRQFKQVQEQFWTGNFDISTVPNRCYEMFLPGQATRMAALVAAMACAAVLLLLVRQNKAAHWYLFIVILVPVTAASIASAVGRNVFVIRYLIFTHLFVLIAIAATVGMIRDTFVRNAAAIFLLVIGSSIYFDSWRSLNIESKPGMHAAVQYIQARRQPGEPVIACSSLLYFPAQYYLRDRLTCHLYSSGAAISHNQGGPFTVPEDLINFEQIDNARSGRVWVISGGWSPAMVPIPQDWRSENRKTFPEVYAFQGNITVESFVVPRR